MSMRQAFKTHAFSPAIAALAILCACSSNNNNPYFQPLNPSPCSYLNATQLQLVYPAPNATAVPDSLAQVIIATNVVFPQSYNAVLIGTSLGSTQPFFFSTFLPATQPLPAGSVPATFPNPIYYASTNSNAVTFDRGTPVTVRLNDTATNCTPGAPVGSFTVQ